MNHIMVAKHDDPRLDARGAHSLPCIRGAIGVSVVCVVVTASIRPVRQILRSELLTRLFTSTVVKSYFLGFGCLLVVGAVAAADRANEPPPNAGATGGAPEYIFSAPPKGDANTEKATYEPLAAYLSQATGQKFIYRYPGNWLTYQSEMLRGHYDLLVDGPHFAAWRADWQTHVVLAKMPGEHIFVVIVKADNAKLNEMKDLAGRAVCAHAPPNLGTLTLLSQFPNAARQPYLREIKGWNNAYQGIGEGKCVATIIPLRSLEKFENGKTTMKILHRFRATPDQTFTAGPRVPPEVRTKLSAALVSDGVKKPAAKLLETHNIPGFVVAHPEEYAGFSDLLKNEFGFRDLMGQTAQSAKR